MTGLKMEDAKPRIRRDIWCSKGFFAGAEFGLTGDLVSGGG